MDRGTKLSAALHAGLILWVALGDFFFSSDVPPPIEAASVSLITDAELRGLEARAPKVENPDDQPKAAPPTAPPAAPVAQDTPPDVPPDLPTAAEAQPIEAPTPTAPLAAEEQPVLVPDSPVPPKPRPIDRVAAVPVDDKTDTPEIADTPTPEVSDQAAPDAPVVTIDQPAASPQEAAPVIVTEAVETQLDAPQLAPTSSRRPQARPNPVVQDPAPQDPAPEVDAIAAALAEAADTAPETPTNATAGNGTSQDIPEGPPMSGSEVEGLRVAINKCWNVGQLSSEALRTVVTLRVEMSEAGKPTSVEMTNYEGGSEAAAQKAFEAGRRAVMRCAGTNGYDLPPEKYGQWNVLNLIFDPEGMRLR